MHPTTSAPMPAALPSGAERARAQALSGALAASHFTSAPVRAALTGYVREARDAGTPPERVIVALKALLQPHEAHAPRPADGAPGLREQLVQWAIAAYYRAD